MIWLLTILTSIGLATVVTSVFLLALKKIQISGAEKFKSVPFNVHQAKALAQKPKFNREDFRLLIFIGLGACLFSVLFYKILILPISLFLGVAVGFVGYKCSVNLIKKSIEFQKIKEVSLLYECIDLFTKANFTVRQSLQMSQIIVPALAPEIRKCLDRWPFGPLKALEQLGTDIGLQQAELLSGLLMEVEEGGTKNISGAMEQEAVRLEEIRESLAESRIATKPIYSAVYLFLPVASVLGILIAPLAYRAIQMISGIHAGGL